MKVFVNKKDKIVPVGCSVETLTEILGIKKDESIAIAIEMEVIDKEKWSNTILKEGDKVTLIRATCGG